MLGGPSLSMSICIDLLGSLWPKLTKGKCMRRVCDLFLASGLSGLTLRSIRTCLYFCVLSLALQSNKTITFLLLFIFFQAHLNWKGQLRVEALPYMLNQTNLSTYGNTTSLSAKMETQHRYPILSTCLILLSPPARVFRLRHTWMNISKTLCTLVHIFTTHTYKLDNPLHKCYPV